MSKIVEKLTEGIVQRDTRKESQAMLTKWESTGLLEGLQSEYERGNMALMLENQAKNILKEATTMASGEVEGFASVAFPMVRRIFGGLIANDLVSVQPMSLPAGLIFFMDFKFNGTRGPGGALAEGSLYGGGVVGSEITGGVSLDDSVAGGNTVNQEQGFYNLANGYSSPTGSSTLTSLTVVFSGTAGQVYSAGDVAATGMQEYDGGRLTRYDPDVSGTLVAVATFSGSNLSNFNDRNLVTLHNTGSGRSVLLRRLTQPDYSRPGNYLVVLAATGSETTAELAAELDQMSVWQHAITDSFQSGRNTDLGAVRGGTTDWGLEDEAFIPEIDIRVDSVSVTAVTKKLKAKWTQELGQDLSAFHNMDAEAELTGVLSEHIALEIDREILEDLIKNATAGKYYWSRRPGKFVNRTTGVGIEGGLTANESLLGGDFTGTVSEWYETLAETINDISANIHRKTLRGGANFLVTSPEISNILEFTSGFRAQVSHDEARGTVGTVKVANLNKKFDVYVDPYFPRNLVLVGRKGSSFLESGYVYAPYVPLQTTPTIFGTEDFVPRKGVMTRYAKKMVRPDMYGLVVVTDMNG